MKGGEGGVNDVTISKLMKTPRCGEANPEESKEMQWRVSLGVLPQTGLKRRWCAANAESACSPALQTQPSIHLKKNSRARDVQVNCNSNSLRLCTFPALVRLPCSSLAGGLGFDRSTVRSDYVKKTFCSGNQVFGKLE